MSMDGESDGALQAMDLIGGYEGFSSGNESDGNGEQTRLTKLLADFALFCCCLTDTNVLFQASTSKRPQTAGVTTIRTSWKSLPTAALQK